MNYYKLCNLICHILVLHMMLRLIGGFCYLLINYYFQVALEWTAEYHAINIEKVVDTNTTQSKNTDNKFMSNIRTGTTQFSISDDKLYTIVPVIAVNKQK
jgi:hypothetical protein